MGTLASFPRIKVLFEGLFGGEISLVVGENFTNPLNWSLLLKRDVYYVTHRIRKYVVHGDATGAWRLKESYEKTFAMEAVAVSPFIHSESTVINRRRSIHPNASS
jgi:hypothetical protein